MKKKKSLSISWTFLITSKLAKIRYLVVEKGIGFTWDSCERPPMGPWGAVHTWEGGQWASIKALSLFFSAFLYSLTRASTRHHPNGSIQRVKEGETKWLFGFLSNLFFFLYLFHFFFYFICSSFLRQLSKCAIRFFFLQRRLYNVPLFCFITFPNVIRMERSEEKSRRRWLNRRNSRN